MRRPCRCDLACVLKDPSPDLVDDSDFFRQGYEFIRQNVTIPAVGQPQQRFEADKPRVMVDQRLEEQVEFAGIDRLAQAAFGLALLIEFVPHGRRKQYVAVTPRILCLVKRDVGVLEYLGSATNWR